MDRGRVKKSMCRCCAVSCCQMTSIWYVRNKDGGMVPFSAFARPRWETGSPRLERYNGYSAVEIVRSRTGVSTGTAMDIMESLVKQLPNGFGLEWTAMSYQSGFPARRLRRCTYFLAGRYSCVWLRCRKLVGAPFSVMLVVPLGVIGALLATDARAGKRRLLPVGLLTVVIGLSAKTPS